MDTAKLKLYRDFLLLTSTATGATQVALPAAAITKSSNENSSTDAQGNEDEAKLVIHKAPKTETPKLETSGAGSVNDTNEVATASEPEPDPGKVKQKIREALLFNEIEKAVFLIKYSNTSFMDEYGECSLLDLAIKQGKRVVVEALVEKIDIKAYKNDSAIVDAIKSENISLATVLMEKGIGDINYVDALSESALTLAIKTKNEEFALKVLAQGADPNGGNDRSYSNLGSLYEYYSPLMLAVLYNQPKLLKALIEKGAKVDIQRRVYGSTRTALSLATDTNNDRRDVIVSLLKAYLLGLGDYVNENSSLYKLTPENVSLSGTLINAKNIDGLIYGIRKLDPEILRGAIYTPESGITKEFAQKHGLVALSDSSLSKVGDFAFRTFIADKDAIFIASLVASGKAQGKNLDNLTVKDPGARQIVNLLNRNQFDEAQVLARDILAGRMGGDD